MEKLMCECVIESVYMKKKHRDLVKVRKETDRDLQDMGTYVEDRMKETKEEAMKKEELWCKEKQVLRKLNNALVIERKKAMDAEKE